MCMRGKWRFLSCRGFRFALFIPRAHRAQHTGTVIPAQAGIHNAVPLETPLPPSYLPPLRRGRGGYPPAREWQSWYTGCLLLMDAIIQQLAQTLREASTNNTPLRIIGGGTKDFYGNPTAGETLSTSAYRGIVDYEPTELVITARAGTPLAEIETALREKGQMLAFEPPHFGAPPSPLTPLPQRGEGKSTLGGCIAAGLSGPRRPYAGAVRDLLLGVRILDGQGADLRFGGQVMKNVAGFDVSRLMVGALGTLGVILEVSLKTLPLPATEMTLHQQQSEADAIRLMNEWAALPLPISATAWRGGDLGIRLSGAASAVEAARKKLGGAVIDTEQTQRFWHGIRDHTDPFFANRSASSIDLSMIRDIPNPFALSLSKGVAIRQGFDKPVLSPVEGPSPNGATNYERLSNLWRLSVKSTTPAITLPGTQLIEWSGALRWFQTEASAEAVRSAASQAGGHATLFRGADRTAGVFHPLSPALAAIHRKIKHTFDPVGILNPGRLYRDI
jgi:glycolate oxidase FAD binding subunit